MKKYLSLFTVLLISAVALGAKIGDDELVVGKTGSTADKTIKMGTQKIRSNQSSQKLEFTNDGTNYKAFGSGSGGGGGVDYLQDLNGDFEGGTTGWTASGGTFTAISSGQIAGSISGQWDPSATAQTFQSSLITKLAGANGRSCSASFEYNWNGTLGHYLAEVLDQTNAVIATSILNPTTTLGTSVSQIPLFDCDAATQFRIRLTTTADATAIKIDSAFIGYGRNSQQISQAAPYARIQYGSFTSAVGWQNYGGTGTVDVGSPTFYVDGTKSLTLNTPGNYQVIYRACTSVVSAADIAVGLHINGVDNLEGSIHAAVSGDTGCRVATAMVVNPTANGVLRLRVYTDIASVVFATGQLAVYKFPSSPADANTFETSGWTVDAITGGAIGGLGGTTIVTNTPIESASFSLSSNIGTIPAKIACSGANPATGSTCAVGNESLGITFNLPSAGRVNVCAGFSHYIQTGTGGNAGVAFSIVETPNNAQTEIQRAGFSIDAHDVQNQTVTYPHRICGVLNFASAGDKTIRLNYTMGAVGTIPNNYVNANGVQWSVYPISQQFPTPVFTDLKNSLDSKPTLINRNNSYNITQASVNSSGALTSSTGNVASTSRTAAGDYTVNFTGGHSAYNECLCTSFDVSGARCGIISHNINGVRVQVRNSAGSAQDATTQILCFGR